MATTAAAAAAAAETDARAAGGGRSHPEAEMVAAAAGAGAGGGGGSSHRAPVKLCVTNVYNSTSSEVVSLEATDTIGDLKRLLQEAFSGRPAPSQQRLIFRGKQCEESQQLGHVLRGLDLSGQHNMHLIVSPSVEQPPPPASLGDGDGGSTKAPEAQPSTSTSTSTSPPQRRPQLLSTREGGVRSSGTAPAPAPSPLFGVHTSAASASASSSSASSSAAATGAHPDSRRIQLNQAQLSQLQWQYRQALRENEAALEAHRQRFDFLSAQSRALTQQQHYQHGAPHPTAYRPTPQQQQQQPQPQLQLRQQHPQAEADEREVSVRAATRALGGNMPGPAGGGGVRDITGPPPPGQIPAAGLGEGGDAGRGNLADPPPRAPDIGREARGYLKMVMQCLLVTLVFGIDADGWVLGLLALGGFLAFLFRTGLLKEMLGSGREGGGLWRRLCTGATVITEDGGRLMDLRFLCSAFFFSLFPKWQPARSPEAIAAEAAEQAQARDAQAQAAAVRAGRSAQAYVAAQEAAAAAAAEANAVPAGQAAASPAAPGLVGAGAGDAAPGVRGEGEREREGGLGGRAGEAAANNTAPAEREPGARPADVNPALPD